MQTSTSARLLHAGRFIHLALIIGLLLLQFWLRTYNIGVQEAFVDEGFHVERGEIVWHFQINPGQFSDGKFLFYFWVGLFSGPHSTAIPASRLPVALFSMLTGASLYILGKMFYSSRAGLLALALYAIFPLAIFHDRMALADPFATTFGALVLWRSIIFA